MSDTQLIDGAVHALGKIKGFGRSSCCIQHPEFFTPQSKKDISRAP